MSMTSPDNWLPNSLANGDSVSLTAAEIRFLKRAISQRMAKEHLGFDENGVGGEHLAGSGRIFVGAYTGGENVFPTTKPDGVTLLDEDDIGRLAFDTTTKRCYVLTSISPVTWDLIMPDVNFGDWQEKSFNTTYTATTSGIVNAYGWNSHLVGLTGESLVTRTQHCLYHSGSGSGICMPVKKGHIWQVTISVGGGGSGSCYWIPLGD